MRQVLFAAILGLCTAVLAQAPVYPAKHWEKIADPEKAGWSSAGLEAVREKLAATKTSGLIAIHGGRVLFEYGDVSRPAVVASVRKSLLSALYGKHVAAGEINLDATLADLGIDDIGGLTANEKEATVRDLLEARSGVYHPASNSGDDSSQAPARGSQAHGTYYLYNNWDFNALGTIFEKRTGKNLYDAFTVEIAQPLGMEDFTRAAQKKTGNLSRSMHPAYHFHISVRDLARVGYLMLRQGDWNGTQIVPRAWVRESTRAVTPVAEMNPGFRRKGPFGYGYLWWVWDKPWNGGAYDGAFTAIGMGGQHLTVMPAIDLVVAHETPGSRAGTHREYWQVLEALVRARLDPGH